MKMLTVPPYHDDPVIREKLYEMALEATLLAEEDFNLYIARKRPRLVGNYLYGEDENGCKTVYALASAGHYVYVGVLFTESKEFMPALIEE